MAFTLRTATIAPFTSAANHNKKLSESAMTQIRTLFDTGKDIYRAIEKVITYQASQEQRL